jgi:MFS transporter, DHA2 family, multidrug resistance protein
LVQIGLLITPWPIAIAFARLCQGVWSNAIPLAFWVASDFCFSREGYHARFVLPAHPATPDVVWRMALIGAGFGLFQSPNNRTMIAAAPRERSGGASGMLGTARLLGQTIGPALVALLLARYPVKGTVARIRFGSESRQSRFARRCAW